jgi:Putative polyhydroxyalkanoic acid system protein (PHA_gran_rgn)
MPKITVRVPNSDPKGALAKIRPALEKTVTDFQGHDLELTDSDSGMAFKFKSMAFTITGRVLTEPTDVVVEVDLPFAAMMFKDKAEKAITKNITRALAPPA